MYKDKEPNKNYKITKKEKLEDIIKIVKVGKWFPLFWGGCIASACFCFTFVYKKWWDETDDIRKKTTLIHELHHCKQQKKQWLFWHLIYIFSWRQRLNYEVDAYALSIKVIKDNTPNWTQRHLEREVDWMARTLASIAYLWTGSYEKNYKKIMNAYLTTYEGKK